MLLIFKPYMLVNFLYENSRVYNMLEGMVQDIFNLSFIKPHKHLRYGWAALIDFEQNNIDYSKWDNIKKDSVVFFLKKTYGGVEYR